MNKRDAINHIRQFGGRLDRFRKSVGGSGDGGRNAPKRAKSSPKPVNRKTNVFNEQVRYAFHGALQDLKSKPFATFLTVMVIAISLTLPSVCYMVYKNVNQAATQYYPSPQITVYLQKTLDDDAAAGVVAQLQAEQGVERAETDWCDGWFHPAPVPVRWRTAGIFWRIVVTNFVRNSGTAIVIGGCGSGTGFRNEV